MVHRCYFSTQHAESHQELRRTGTALDSFARCVLVSARAIWYIYQVGKDGRSQLKDGRSQL